MRIEQLHPNMTPYRWVSRSLKASTWSTMDVEVWSPSVPLKYRARELWHYGTLMGLWVEVNMSDGSGNPPPYGESGTWLYVPLSYGWGSASDAAGVRKIVGAPWQYRRDARGGGPRYVCHGTSADCNPDGFEWLPVCLTYTYERRYIMRPHVQYVGTSVPQRAA